MRLEKVFNILVALLLVWLAFRQGSMALRNLDFEGRPAPPIEVPTIAGGTFDLAAAARPLVVVFWATWCGPCQMELARVNRLIENHEIQAESVLAISSYEDRALVAKTVSERKYLFPVGIDSAGTVAQSYGVAATPTLVLIDKSRNIKWQTSGLSPLLGYRIVNFVNE